MLVALVSTLAATVECSALHSLAWIKRPRPCQAPAAMPPTVIFWQAMLAPDDYSALEDEVLVLTLAPDPDIEFAIGSELQRRHYDRVWNAIHRTLESFGAPTDAVQKLTVGTFLWLYNAGGALKFRAYRQEKPQVPFRAWLLRCAFNRAVDWIRNEGPPEGMISLDDSVSDHDQDGNGPIRVGDRVSSPVPEEISASEEANLRARRIDVPADELVHHLEKEILDLEKEILELERRVDEAHRVNSLPRTLRECLRTLHQTNQNYFIAVHLCCAVRLTTTEAAALLRKRKAIVDGWKTHGLDKIRSCLSSKGFTIPLPQTNYGKENFHELLLMLPLAVGESRQEQRTAEEGA